MQIKSLRFKGMCLLACLFAFGLYQSGVYQQELRPSQNFLSFEALPAYLLSIVFTGLYPMGRIRKIGMHSILMVRPFSTFILALGQMLAALFSLLFPLMIFFFIPGLILRWQFEMEYPIPPLFYVLLFYFISGICCVLSISIWIRTCFKNNIMALIILGFIFAGTGLLANSSLINTQGPNGPVHNFVPMVSLFSHAYWNRIRDLENQPYTQFARLNDWFNFLLSAVYACLFLLLTCYHLRRTEPQRKVLGSYGRRWYHTPTFLKIACDLKIDPHVGFRSHVILLLLVGVILTKTGWPMIRPWWHNVMAYKEIGASGALSNQDRAELEKRFDPNKISEDSLVKINVIREDQVFQNGKLNSLITFTHDRSASETLAVITPWGRWGFILDKIILEDRKLPFINHAENYFIEAKEFQSLEEGKEHSLTFQASINQSAMGESADEYLYRFLSRGYEFVTKMRSFRDSSDNLKKSYWIDRRKLWPTHLTMSVAGTMQLVDSPVPPYKVEREPEKEKWKFWEKGPYATYYFDIPANRSGYRSWINFLFEGQKIVELDVPDLPIRFVVEKRKAKILEQILEGAVPVIKEFCGLYKISFSEPVILWTSQGGDMQSSMFEIQRIQTRFWANQWWRDHLFELLDKFQKDMLKKLFYQTLTGHGPNSSSDFWDLPSFMDININKGLNNRIFGTGQFESFSFSPVQSHLDAKKAKQMENLTREEMLQQQDIPAFQMLYLVMGHEAWIHMLEKLRADVQETLLSPDLLQKSASGAYDKPLDWFFEYWMKNGKGLPRYRVDYARARMVSTEDEEETIYEVKAQIVNEGTGRMPVPMQVDTSKGPVTGEVWIGPGEAVTWKVTTKALPRNMSVDPQGWILTAPAWDEKLKDWIANPGAPVEILKTEKRLM
jgi:ABC-type transport system involved in multi-copper enzyme maturation permease subunit